MRFFAGAFALAGIAFAGGAGNFDGTFSRMAGMAGESYSINAVFDDIGGLEPGAKVTIAGIKVGSVEAVRLVKGLASVDIDIDSSVGIEDDAVASIKTDGLLGGKYVQITPGGSDNLVADGGSLRETESALDVERLISMQVCGGV